MTIEQKLKQGVWDYKETQINLPFNIHQKRLLADHHCCLLSPALKSQEDEAGLVQELKILHSILQKAAHPDAAPVDLVDPDPAVEGRFFCRVYQIKTN